MKTNNHTEQYPFELDAEEKKILADIEAGHYFSVPNLEAEKKRLQAYARFTLRSKPISIRVNNTDLLNIRAKATKEGIPYQTLISSVLHKFAST